MPLQRGSSSAAVVVVVDAADVAIVSDAADAAAVSDAADAAIVFADAAPFAAIFDAAACRRLMNSSAATVTCNWKPRSRTAKKCLENLMQSAIKRVKNLEQQPRSFAWQLHDSGRGGVGGGAAAGTGGGGRAWWMDGAEQGAGIFPAFVRLLTICYCIKL
jgi:hypothetical protein